MSSGAFCLIREKSVDADGRLLLIVQSWDSEEHFMDAPGAPHSIQHHRIGPRMTYTRRPGSRFAFDGTPRRCLPTDDIQSQIVGILNKHHAPGQRQYDLGTEIPRSNDDKHGYLAHPHVQAIEVTK